MTIILKAFSIPLRDNGLGYTNPDIRISLPNTHHRMSANYPQRDWGQGEEQGIKGGRERERRKRRGTYTAWNGTWCSGLSAHHENGIIKVNYRRPPQSQGFVVPTFTRGFGSSNQKGLSIRLGGGGGIRKGESLYSDMAVPSKAGEFLFKYQILLWIYIRTYLPIVCISTYLSNISSRTP